jgi:hypothetical protein
MKKISLFLFLAIGLLQLEAAPLKDFNFAAPKGFSLVNTLSEAQFSFVSSKSSKLRPSSLFVHVLDEAYAKDLSNKTTIRAAYIAETIRLFESRGRIQIKFISTEKYKNGVRFVFDFTESAERNRRVRDSLIFLPLDSAHTLYVDLESATEKHVEDLAALEKSIGDLNK